MGNLLDQPSGSGCSSFSSSPPPANQPVFSVMGNLLAQPLGSGSSSFSFSPPPANQPVFSVMGTSSGIVDYRYLGPAHKPAGHAVVIDYLDYTQEPAGKRTRRAFICKFKPGRGDTARGQINVLGARMGWPGKPVSYARTPCDTLYSPGLLLAGFTRGVL